MILSGGKIWFTAAELADLALPGLPKSKRKVNELAEDQRWGIQSDGAGLPLARQRQARGGGVEYHYSVLPPAAKAELAKRGIVFEAAGPANDDADSANDRLWSWYAGQSPAVKAEAERRFAILARIDLFEGAGMTRSSAVSTVAKDMGVGASTLWNWLELVKGIPAAHRLPRLAPQRKGGGKEADVDPMLWQELLSLYLRPEKPTWEKAFRDVSKIAATRGQALPHKKTLWRKFEREVPPQVVTLKRGGADQLRQMLPPQLRTVAELSALELVNIDGHRVDVFVRMPSGEITRPTMIGIQDVYSRMALSWRIAPTEDAVTARMVFADLFRTWGVPKGLLSDNGRAFASKLLTGQVATRHRFKIKPDDLEGLLPKMGVNVHWAKPYRGSSKPIERMFRDLCEDVAKDVRFAGAYTGNRPDAKPENYGNAAIPFADFVRIWNEGVHEHNARLGRRTEMAAGRLSFKQVFDASYATAQIGKASEEQLALALLSADWRTAHRKNGSVEVGGNRYWCEQMAHHRGERLIVRFDPEDLRQPLRIYDANDQMLCIAPLWEATGFLDMEGAKERARLESAWKRKARAQTDALQLLSAQEVAGRMPAAQEPEAAPTPSVIRAVRPGRRGGAQALLKADQEAPQSLPRQSSIDRITAAALRLVPRED